jgi:hypothetical protein
MPRKSGPGRPSRYGAVTKGYFVDMKTTTHISVICAIGGLFVSSALVGLDIAWHGYCPVFARVPACYLVFGSFLAVLLSLAAPRPYGAWLFWTGAGAGGFLAVWFSAAHLLNLASCPVVFGIPLCNVSFVVFAVLIAARMRS